MNRRAVLASMGAALGLALIIPLKRVIDSNSDIDPGKVTADAKLFLAEERDTIAALSEVIIPTTETPGAIGAGVPEYIIFMLSEWYSEDERSAFTKGLKSLVAYVSAQDGSGFNELSEARQTEIVQLMHDGGVADMDDGGKTFFEHIKQLTLAGYYTSEVGMTQERIYLPVPGKFDGFYPYEKAGTLFTS